MGLIIFINKTQKRMIFCAFLLIIFLLSFMTFLLVKDTFAKESDEIKTEENETIVSLMTIDPIIVEKEVAVPADYIKVNGRLYTPDDVMNLLEATGSRIPSFQKWLDRLLDNAEDDLDMVYGHNVYKSGEYKIEDVEPEDCSIEFDHGRFDEGVVVCSDVEIRIGNSYFRCYVDIYFEKNIDYENGRIRNCVKKPLF